MDFIKKMKLKHFFSLIAQMQNHQHISKKFCLRNRFTLCKMIKTKQPVDLRR